MPPTGRDNFATDAEVGCDRSSNPDTRQLKTREPHRLSEPFARHTARARSDAYGRDSTRALVSDCWLKALDDARTGS